MQDCAMADGGVSLNAKRLLSRICRRTLQRFSEVAERRIQTRSE